MSEHAGSVRTSTVPRLGLILLGLLGAAAVAVLVALAGATLALMMALAALVLVAAVYMPGIPLALYFLIPLYKGALQPFSPIDLTVLLALLNAAQIIPVLMGRRFHHISVIGLTLWAAMAVLVLAGVFLSPDASVAFGRTIDVWALLFIPVIPACLRVGSSERYLKQVVLTFLGAGLLTVGLGIASLTSAQRLTVFDTNTIWTGRAAMLVPLLAMILVPQTRSRPIRIAAVVASILAVLVGLASGSRGPLVALLLIGALGIVIAVVNDRGPGWRTLAAIALIAMLGLGIVASGAINLPAVATDRFSELGDFVGAGIASGNDGVTGDTSSQARVLLFGFAIELFEQNPLLGVGTAGFPVLSPAALGNFDANAYPHNAFLQIGAEHGLIGLAIMGTLVWLALTRKLPLRTYGHAIRLIFIFYLLNAMVSGDVFDDRVTWGMMMLILLMDVVPGTVPAVAARASTTGPPSPVVMPNAPPLAWPVRPDPPRAGPGPYAVPFHAAPLNIGGGTPAAHDTPDAQRGNLTSGGSGPAST